MNAAPPREHSDVGGMSTAGSAGVPAMVLGTMTLGDTVDADRAAAIVRAALDHGVNSFDTANGYATGRSETILGDLLAGQRDHVQIATKAGIYPGDAAGHPLLSREGMTRSLEASLARLRTDHVDVFYLHQPDRSVPLHETIAAVGQLMAQGLVRSFGVSNYAAWQIADILTVCDQLSVPRPIVAQQLYNLLARRVEDEYLEFAITHELPTMVYNPLAGGLLAARHVTADLAAAGRFGSSVLAPMYRDRYWNAPTRAAVTALAKIASEHAMTPVELAIRWCLSKPGIASVLLGASQSEHVTANARAVQAGPLPKPLVDACDTLTDPLHGTMPRYNR